MFGSSNASDEEKVKNNKKPISTKMYWWLSRKRPFFIGDDYEIRLLEVDRQSGCVKIEVINSKTGEVSQEDITT